MMMSPIKVWKFHDAPTLLRELSTNGGDEDWIALVPNSYEGEYISWMQEGTPFGCCCVDKYTHEDYEGFEIFIGCHA